MLLLPKFIAEKTFSAAVLIPVFKKASSILKKLEWLIKPRLPKLVQFGVFQRVIGLLIFICGFVMFLPLPPGTNFPPAIVCVLLSVGLLEKDLAMILLGISAFVGISVAGFHLFHYFAEYILALLN